MRVTDVTLDFRFNGCIGCRFRVGRHRKLSGSGPSTNTSVGKPNRTIITVAFRVQRITALNSKLNLNGSHAYPKPNPKPRPDSHPRTCHWWSPGPVSLRGSSPSYRAWASPPRRCSCTGRGARCWCRTTPGSATAKTACSPQCLEGGTPGGRRGKDLWLMFGLRVRVRLRLLRIPILIFYSKVLCIKARVGAGTYKQLYG